jgi:hypothetical protein
VCAPIWSSLMSMLLFACAGANVFPGCDNYISTYPIFVKHVKQLSWRDKEFNFLYSFRIRLTSHHICLYFSHSRERNSLIPSSNQQKKIQITVQRECRWKKETPPPNIFSRQYRTVWELQWKRVNNSRSHIYAHCADHS